MKNLALIFLVAATACAITIGLVPIGAHQKWWELAPAVPLIKPLCVVGYVLLMAFAVALALDATRPRKA